MTRRWHGVWRILDANLNRAREAARVAEEYARFVLDSDEYARRLKELRHRLRELAESLDAGTGRLLAARDTPGDVGTPIGTALEGRRDSDVDVATAALKRLEEALRVIEEYAKIAAPAGTVPADAAPGAAAAGAAAAGAAASLAQALRYEVYAIECSLLGRRSRLRDARLYVIVTAGLCRGRDVADVTAAAVRGGAEIIQLREKDMNGGPLLESAKRLRRVTADAGALFVVNDRTDIAAACDADGVHLGQTDLPCAEARKLLGANAIIGLTTHSIEEARRAEAAGADYIGVGTIFDTQTKAPSRLAGTEFVRAVAAEITIPAFPIGGINALNLPQVIGAGGGRAAVCTAVIAADDVEAAARELRAQLPRRQDDDEGHQ